MKNNRIVYFDYLRIIAIFAVIVLHIAGHNWHGTDVNSFEWQMINIYDSIVRWGVPVFVMISGALFLGKDISIKTLYKKYIFRIFISLFFWSTLYALWNSFVIEKSYSIKELIKEILFGHYHLWFLFMIIGLYIIVPFLNKIVLDKKIAWYFVIIAFAFAFFIPQCTKIVGLKFGGISNILTEIVSKLKLHMVLGFSGYYVLGYLLNEIRIEKKHRLIIYILGIIGLAFTTISSSVLSLIWQSPVEMFYGNLTVNTLLVSVSVFVFAKTHLNYPLSSIRKQNIFMFLSKCSFGTYLIHPFFIESLNKFLNITSLSFNPVLSVPALSILVFIFSLAFSIVLNKIPFVNKWIV